jgi:hypothetical protein
MVGSGRGQGSKLIPQLKCRGSLAYSSRLKGTGMNRDMKSFLLSIMLLALHSICKTER